MVKNVVANSDVNEQRQKDADPDGDVVRIHAHNAPLCTDPAPELSSM
jgi:hypothetical protein